MSVLLLRLAAPLQSWGIASKYNHRHTHTEPTKSGIVGLLAAASGRRRTEPIEDLAGLRLGIRLDQPGELLRDYHTAATTPRRTTDTSRGHVATLPTHRWYLADAVFLAAVEGPDAMLATLDDALRHPAFPLYLGRRSCPPAGPLSLGVRVSNLEDTLAAEPWHASPQRRRRENRQRLSLQTVIDDNHGGDLLNDLPLTFDPIDRRHGWRRVQRGWVEVPNPDAPDGQTANTTSQPSHDPFEMLRW